MSGEASTRIRRVVWLLFLLYVFLTAVTLMSAAFKLAGRDFSQMLLETTSSPLVGLMIGMLATAVIQSSSTTTSVVVGLASSGALSVANAIPIVMGANIGTTVTNTIVALTTVRRRDEFRRSFAAATMHDFFNLMVLAVLFPLELLTGYLARTSQALSRFLVGSGSIEFHSPVKAITKPVASRVLDAIAATGWGDGAVAAAGVLVALVALFLALTRLPRLLRSLFLARAESAFFGVMTGGGLPALAVGILITVLVQSSSITTSLLVPLVAAGILSLGAAFPITVGANVGTTVTALLASTAGTADGVTIALAHLLFNLSGILIVWPVPAVRRVPVRLAERLAEASSRSGVFAFAYVIAVFFGIPGLVILSQRLFGG